MLNRLNNERNRLNELIRSYDIKRKSCNICNGKGLKERKIKALGQDMIVNSQCECQIIDGEYRFDIEKRINDINNIIQRISIYIPKNFQYGCYYENIDNRIKDFLNNNKLFCWIHGITGTGKTYSLYSIKIKTLLSNNVYKFLDIVKEAEFNYKTDIRNKIAIDDIGISVNENRNVNLSDLYFTLIDYKVENNQKLILTSNYSYKDWIVEMSKINVMNASRIDSRISNNIDIIELKGQDRRKIKEM